jgi:hypothetical protein
MGDKVFEPDWIEGGFYGQVLTGGVYIGWNDDGLAVRITVTVHLT